MTIGPDIRDAATAAMPDHRSLRVEPLDGGSSAFVALLTMVSPDGRQRRVIFRQHTDQVGKKHSETVAAKEFHLTRALTDADLAVPEPLALGDASTANGPWLVTEWIDGSSVVAESDLDAALSEMAQFLARLHAIDVAPLDVPGLTEIEDPAQMLPDYVQDDDVGRAIQHALEVGLHRQPNANVLVHGDYWPGNLLFQGRRLVAVIDWEDAQTGDPLADLACTRVELVCAYGGLAGERFTELYLDASRHLGAELVLTDLPLWEVYVCSTALWSMHRWGLSPGDEAERRRTTKRLLEAAVGRLAPGSMTPYLGYG